MAKIIVVTSGKGGVGKTTTSAAIGSGLAMRGHRTVVVDFDVGLRNLDLIMGCERRVVYDFINVIQGDATLNQALIKDKRLENLYVLAASQTRDKDALSDEGVARVMGELSDQFDFVICDSPAGIEKGAHMAMYHADEAIVVTNPEVSSVRDSDRMLGLLSSKSRRAELDMEPIKEFLLLTRYDAARAAQRNETLRTQPVALQFAPRALRCLRAGAEHRQHRLAALGVQGQGAGLVHPLAAAVVDGPAAAAGARDHMAKGRKGGIAQRLGVKHQHRGGPGHENPTLSMPGAPIFHH